MNRSSNRKNVQRAWWIGGVAIAAALVVPAVPALAGAFNGSAAAAATAGPEVVHLEIVSSSVIPKLGQIVQPAKPNTMIYVGCSRGTAVGGGYVLGKGAKTGLVTSAPSADGKRWNFQYPGVVPVGTQFSAVCWR